MQIETVKYKLRRMGCSREQIDLHIRRLTDRE
jgi:hypothetical protein